MGREDPAHCVHVKSPAAVTQAFGCLFWQDVYETFNVILRRKPKENNFKAVLETIRDLMNTNCVVPDWLHDLILGYGNPDAAHYSR